MAEPTTFIKLDRNILDWRWYKDPNTFKLFIHLLLKANYEDKGWHSETIHRGELVTSLSRLSGETGMSVQAVRTALDHLAQTEEITQRSTAQYTVIAVINYDKYQRYATNQQHSPKPYAPTASEVGNPRANKLATNEQHGLKNIKKEGISKDIPKKERFDPDSKPYKCATYLAKRIAERLPNKKISEKQIQSWASDFDKLNRIDKQDWKDIAAVLDFSQTDAFWQVNILSAGKFRKQYDQLYLKMQREDA